MAEIGNFAVNEILRARRFRYLEICMDGQTGMGPFFQAFFMGFFRTVGGFFWNKTLQATIVANVKFAANRYFAFSWKSSEKVEFQVLIEKRHTFSFGAIETWFL